MTSSFSTVIGTPRDDIPKLPVSNYADSAPDLTEAVEEGNEAFKEDLARHFDSVAKIEELRVKNFWDNLSGLEGLLGKANEFNQIREADREAREKLKGLRNINKEELDRVSGKLDRIMKLEEAERVSELIKLTREGNAQERLIATDLLNQNVLPTGEEIKFGDAKTRFNNTTTSVFNNIVEKNFLITQDTRAGAELVADNTIRDILTDFYYEMHIGGFDINSRQVQNYIDRELLPSLMKEKDKQINTWTALRPQVVQKSLARKNKEDIVEAFTSKSEITTISESGEEIKTVKHNGVFDAEDGEGGLIERLIARNPDITTPAQAIDYIIETLTNDPLLYHKIKVEDLEYFKEEARFIDRSTGNEVFGFANSNFSGLDGVMKFIDEYESKLATSNKDAYDKVYLSMEQVVRDYKVANNKERLDQGEVLHFVTMYNNKLKSRGLPTSYPIPGFMLNDETVGDWKYGNTVEAVGHINNQKWESALRSRLGGVDLPLTITAQIEKAKADLRIQVEAAYAKDDNVSIQALVEKFYPDILDKLQAGEYVDKIDLLRPLLPSDTAKEVNSMMANKDKWLNNKEVNSIYEKRYLDKYLEDYALKGYLPENIPTYIRKLANEAGLSTHEYVMRRLVATGVYDDKTMKFLSENPEDVFKINEEEKKYIFVKPHSSKNILLWNGKEGGLKGTEAKNALLVLRKEGRAVDSYDGRGFGGKVGAFFSPGDQTLSVQEAYDLAKSGGGDNFGLYGISATDLIELVDAGIISKDQEFDENTQDFAAWGLMYIQANKSNSTMGAQTEALDWRYLTGLTETDQATVIQFFPNLRDVPINQFQNLQKDVSNAILSAVEQRRLDTVEDLGLTDLVNQYPSLQERLVDREDGTGILPRRWDNNTVKDVLDFTRPRSSDVEYLKFAANDEGHIALRKHFQDKITKGEYVDNSIRRLLQQSRSTYDKYGAGDDFDYFQNPNHSNPVANFFGGDDDRTGITEEQEPFEQNRVIRDSKPFSTYTGG